jgi:drug/metabolite transporter (DMT)-like permease
MYPDTEARGGVMTITQDRVLNAGRQNEAEPSLRRALPWQVRMVLLAAIWGMSFLFIKVGDEGLAPIEITLGRMMFGSATLLLILAWRGERLPGVGRVWLHLAVASVMLNVLPFSLFAYGELHTSSVLAGIWNATTPLFTAPLAVLVLPSERMTASRLAGLVLGFIGVLVVLGLWQGVGGSALEGNLLCLGAAISYGLGFPYVRKYLAPRHLSALSLAAGQLLCGTVLTAAVMHLLAHSSPTLSLKVVACVFVLGALGTGIAFVLNYGVIRDAGATVASTVTYLIPLFSTVVGVSVLREPLVWNEPVGAAIVILGVAVSQGRVRVGQRAG